MLPRIVSRRFEQTSFILRRKNVFAAEMFDASRHPAASQRVREFEAELRQFVLLPGLVRVFGEVSAVVDAAAFKHQTHRVEDEGIRVFVLSSWVVA